MRENRKKTIRTLLLIFILFLGLGFAALAANLKINGTLNVSRTAWDVHFENVEIKEGSVNASPAPVSDDTTTTEMAYTINFTKPGDYFEFTTDIVNEGTIDAMVDVVSNNAYASAASTTPIALPTYLTSTVTYDDGVEIAQNQELKHGESEKIKVRVEFKKDISVSDLPSSGDTSVVFKFIGDYKQADENARERMKVSPDNKNITKLSATKCTNNINVTVPEGTICKRAIQLHEEECTQRNTTYGCLDAGYTTGSTITYGDCGNYNGVLESGDAFTCDVNGDGVYDELVERFYYVNDYYDTTTNKTDSSTAVLVYYNNVTGGVANNKNGYAYDSSNENWHGPVTAIEQLPTTTQWPNVNLKNNTRAILAEYESTHKSPTTTGGTLPTDFSYQGYAARLLSAIELLRNSDDKISSTFDTYAPLPDYLLENTVYSDASVGLGGSWTETPCANHNEFVWAIIVPTYSRILAFSADVTKSFNIQTQPLGVRPVIEVPKTKIKYY